MIFSVEGNIGAGKTTFSYSLSHMLKDAGHRVLHLTEPVDEWTNFHGQNLLDLFYGNQQRWAFTFQVNALLSMIKRDELAMEYQKKGYVVIKERSIFSVNNLFTPMLARIMTPAEISILKNMSDIMSNISCTASTIYVRTDPEICIQRIHTRGRPEESRIDIAYITDLHRLHEKEISNSLLNVIAADGNSYDLEKPESVKLYGSDKCVFDVVKELLAKGM